jgi:hypothetical protein
MPERLTGYDAFGFFSLVFATSVTLAITAFQVEHLIANERYLWQRSLVIKNELR